MLDIYDPILRGPLFACTLMGAVSALVGIFVVFQKQSLLGEALSHSCYPGMVLGVVLATIFDMNYWMSSIVIFTGAGISAYCGGVLNEFLVRKRLASSDSALAFILAFSFSLGILCISALQITYPRLLRQLQSMLIGQAATIGDKYIVIGFFLLLLVVVIIYIFRRSLLAQLFDFEFAQVQGLSSAPIRALYIGILLLTIIVSIRSMGVVLMSSLLIFPVTIARLITRKCVHLVVLSGLIGGMCGWCGVWFSHVMVLSVDRKLWLPTGPLICLLLAFLFFLALLFSPRSGICIRLYRKRSFERRCVRENVLKALWKMEDKVLTLPQIYGAFPMCKRTLKKVLQRLSARGLVRFLSSGQIELTSEGKKKGRNLVRLHRLWELYLVEYCHIPKERVHPSAEEMEHVLTPDIEKALVHMLQDPKKDPHNQPIPPGENDV